MGSENYTKLRVKICQVHVQNGSKAPKSMVYCYEKETLVTKSTRNPADSKHPFVSRQPLQACRSIYSYILLTPIWKRVAYKLSSLSTCRFSLWTFIIKVQTTSIFCTCCVCLSCPLDFLRGLGDCCFCIASFLSR